VNNARERRRIIKISRWNEVELDAAVQRYYIHTAMRPTFFKSGAEFRAWLEAHHQAETELLVGFHKKASQKKGITYKEALDEALAFGWIDGVRRALDADRYTIRFTPRKLRSIWSAVNIRRVGELTAEGRMADAGLAAFAKRDEKRSAIYAYERAAAELDAESTKVFKADKKAWAFYRAQAPWYQRTSTLWVVSAKRAETRARRLTILIQYSRDGERLPQLTPPRKSPS
jgi:uncharacterized protein YdeI (YjbR/CyaY-like superfamily)